MSGLERPDRVTVGQHPDGLTRGEPSAHLGKAGGVEGPSDRLTCGPSDNSRLIASQVVLNTDVALPGDAVDSSNPVQKAQHFWIEPSVALLLEYNKISLKLSLLIVISLPAIESTNNFWQKSEKILVCYGL